MDITLESEKCPEDYEPLFSRTWQGTKEIPAINMTMIGDGVVACGRRGGQNFIDSKRVDPFTR